MTDAHTNYPAQGTAGGSYKEGDNNSGGEAQFFPDEQGLAAEEVTESRGHLSWDLKDS